YIEQGRSKANALRHQVKHYYDTLYKISYEYNDLLNGKWKHVLSLKQGVTASYFELPKLDSVHVPVDAAMRLFIEGQEPLKGVSSFYTLRACNPARDKTYFIDMVKACKKTLDWNQKASNDWIKVSKSNGRITHGHRVWVSIDWNKVPQGERVSGEIEIIGAGTEEKVRVSVF